jgi:hypothetical protein
MSKITPYFELGKQRYEIKRNRYLSAELDRIRNESGALSAEDEQNIVKLQDKYASLKKLAERVKELEDKYYETFSEEDEAIYKRAKSHYDNVLNDVTRFEIETNGVMSRAQKAGIDNAEKLVIIALQKDDKGNTIRTAEESNDIWCSYVDEVGQATAIEWLLYMVNYISGNDGADEENPFITQAKAKAEQRANMKKGIGKAR